MNLTHRHSVTCVRQEKTEGVLQWDPWEGHLQSARRDGPGSRPPMEAEVVDVRAESLAVISSSRERSTAVRKTSEVQTDAAEVGPNTFTDYPPGCGL